MKFESKIQRLATWLLLCNHGGLTLLMDVSRVNFINFQEKKYFFVPKIAGNRVYTDLVGVDSRTSADKVVTPFNRVENRFNQYSKFGEG